MAYDEDEQIARVKQWWSENWKALAAGLALGLGGIVGWNYWQSAGEQRYEQASIAFSQFRQALDSGAAERAAEHYDVLTSNYRRTPYATAASLKLAATRVQEGDLDAASALLQWAVDNAGDDGLRALARIRLARLNIARGELDAAERLLRPDAGAFAALKEEVRGDLALAQGDRAAAYAAYERALGLAEDMQRDTLRRKLDDLADAAPQGDA